MSEERWTWKAHGLLRDEDGRVLVLEDGARARLPFVEAAILDEDELAGLRDAFAELVGARIAVVRSLGRSVDEESKQLAVGVELEALEPVELRSGTRWLSADELPGLELPSHDSELLELLFSDDGHPLRPPWARRGWLAEAEEWIERTLTELVLRVPTEPGDVYFKATARSPLFVDEGPVTQGLAELFPVRIPRVLAVDSARSWMLTEDFGPVVGWGAPVETRVAVLEDHARLQVEAVDHVDGLLALGLFDRRPAWLATQLESLLDEPGALGLDDTELETLGARIPELVDACGQLAAGPIPDTLVHGYRSILANVEPGSAAELESALPDWLRGALAPDALA